METREQGATGLQKGDSVNVSLEDRLESGNASAWRPDQGDPDVLLGVVTEISWGTSDYAPYLIVTVRQEDGEEKAIHAFHTVLRRELERQKPNIGERIGVKYLGEQEAKNSKYGKFIGYRLKVDRAAGAFDWNQVAPTDEPDPYAAPEPEPVTVPDGAGDDDIPF